MDDTITDYLVMTLSADCFVDLWDELGYCVVGTKKKQLLEACRSAVADIMALATAQKSETYYLTSFTNERLKKTALQFEKILSTLEVTYTPYVDSSEKAEIESIIDSITHRLIRGDLPANLLKDEPKILIAISQAWENRPEINEIRSMWLSSSSDWDLYLKSLTPDEPTMLSDFVTLELGRRKFKVFWKAVNSSLSAEERSKLFTFYTGIAALDYGWELDLSHFAD